MGAVDADSGGQGGGSATALRLRVPVGQHAAMDQAAPGSSYSAPPAGGGVEDEDMELQRALAASMGHELPTGGGGGGSVGAFVPPPFPPPASRQFRPTSAPIPQHHRTGGAIRHDSDEETFDAFDAPPRDHMMDFGGSALPHGQGMGMGIGMRGLGGGAGGGRSAGPGDDDDTDRAFLEAAMKESLDPPQPAMADEDDPLLAEAIQASLREAGGDVLASISARPEAAPAPPVVQHLVDDMPGVDGPAQESFGAVMSHHPEEVPDYIHMSVP